ncbi:LysR family nitrogen assimilation transcriptional regulator [Variovorax boronicumulans]|uniref:LysR family transcriptional regulator n=1 Tax=Variovorax boronicumulans TaxID=436515 RepID=UPI002473F40D|nr:LysR family transcriptional regulator [Variovorax boronicumulans]MDH6166329.1 LysR family nitrogen assimilation transcriptional regulator [Variovorax boronicumulans]
MDLRSLRYFIAVLEAGSLSRAAVSLYVAQPALTAQVKKLEAELGTQLLERSHAGVTPTAAGLQLYQDARRLLSDAAAMRERLQRGPQGPEGSVTVAVPFLLASLLLGPVLARLKHSHPRIRVFVIDELSLMVRKAMVDRRADIGILVDTPSLDGFEVRRFAREAMFICGHDATGEVTALAQATSGKGRRKSAGSGRLQLPFASAARLPLVLQSRRFSIRQHVETAAAELGVELNIAHEHDSARVIRSLYLAGAGFTFSPACALSDGPLSGPPWLVARIVQPEMMRTYSLATPSAAEPDPATRVVMEALVEEARGMIEAGRWEAEFLHGTGKGAGA